MNKDSIILIIGSSHVYVKVCPPSPAVSGWLSLRKLTKPSSHRCVGLLVVLVLVLVLVLGAVV